MKPLIFDIETGGEPDDILATLFDFNAESVKGYDLLGKEFDPATVKTGNMKDAEKIRAKIETAREKFETDKAAVAENIETAKAEAWQEFKDKAALSPLTGRVLAIGLTGDMYKPDECSIKFVRDGVKPVSEKELIETFLELADAVLSDGGSLVGHNIIGFDLPFLLRRGLKFGIKPPKTITTALGNYKPTNLIDTQREWQMGNRMEKFVKLDSLAAFFGTRRKSGNGADFAKMFFGTSEERDAAIDYLRNDVMVSIEVAEKMRLIPSQTKAKEAEVSTQPQAPASPEASKPVSEPAKQATAETNPDDYI